MNDIKIQSEIKDKNKKKMNSFNNYFIEIYEKENNKLILKVKL